MDNEFVRKLDRKSIEKFDAMLAANLSEAGNGMLDAEDDKYSRYAKLMTGEEGIKYLDFQAYQMMNLFYMLQGKEITLQEARDKFKEFFLGHFAITIETWNAFRESMDLESMFNIDPR